MCYNCTMITNTVVTGKEKKYDNNNECRCTCGIITARFRNRNDSGDNNRIQEGELIYVFFNWYYNRCAGSCSYRSGRYNRYRSF